MKVENREPPTANARQRTEAETTRSPEELEELRQKLDASCVRQRGLEERVRQLSGQLETANQELDAFVYSIAHDLRAPLSGIAGWSLALLEDYDSQLNEQAHTFINRIRSESQRMEQRIEAILNLSRLTRVEMREEPVDLSAIAQAVAARLLERAPERPVELAIQPGLSAQGDPHLLTLVLTHLLDNALKFTGKTPQARIVFGQTETQAQRVFFVSDNGVGFDMSFASKLFGAFQRMHKQSDFPGLGIGLATVQRLIRRHGGRVWAEAHISQGATFYFTLEEGSPCRNP